FSEIDDGVMDLEGEKCSLGTVINQVFDSSLPLAEERKVHLINTLPERDLPLIRAHAPYLMEILLVFFSNAILYNNEEGSVWLKVEQNDELIRVMVEDNGCGVSPRLKKDVFTPFKRCGMENSANCGVGLGLPIAEKLTTLMSGHIGFESTKDKGSIFWVEFKIAD
ncbi:MAG: HAMP domain-containing histidine kinase, partial [Alphaproteobacteria bacterium]|nr:HAMP domain-containing histidine kinase [Alphaproteobacteria bacterium]